MSPRITVPSVITDTSSLTGAFVCGAIFAAALALFTGASFMILFSSCNAFLCISLSSFSSFSESKFCAADTSSVLTGAGSLFTSAVFFAASSCLETCSNRPSSLDNSDSTSTSSSKVLTTRSSFNVSSSFTGSSPGIISFIA